MGRVSSGLVAEEALGTGVTKACFQAVGTIPEIRLLLMMESRMCPIE